MSKSSIAVGACLILAGLFFAVLLINSGDWDVALIAGLPPVAIGSWIAVTDKLGPTEPVSPKKPSAKKARMKSPSGSPKKDDPKN